MRTFLPKLLICCALLFGAAPAFALDVTPDKFQDKLKTYDPATVEAAKTYAKTFNMKEMMAKSIPALTNGLMVQLKAKNPELNDTQTRLFVDTFLHNAFVDNGEVLEQAIILMMLDIMNKDELVALNQFYSSPVGAGILKKMPVLMGRIPEINAVMQTYVIPHALEAAKARMQKDGVDVKI